jgi:hypothetical protein
MNKYIILLVILLIMILFYFTYKYDKNNIEKFTEATLSIEPVIDILNTNNLNITDSGQLQINDSLSQNLNIIIDPSGTINIGDEYKFDASNNELKCAGYKLDRFGNFKNDKDLVVDPSGNINIGSFVYNKEGHLIRKDISFKFDPSGNVTMGNYIYTTTGILTTKDNSFQIDPSGNIITPEYIVSTKDRSFSKRDNSIKQDELGNFNCNF